KRITAGAGRRAHLSGMDRAGSHVLEPIARRNDAGGCRRLEGHGRGVSAESVRARRGSRGAGRAAIRPAVVHHFHRLVYSVCAGRDWLLISVETGVPSWCRSMLTPIITIMRSTMPAENIHIARISRFSLFGSTSSAMSSSDFNGNGTAGSL